MSRQKNILATIGLVLSVSLITSALSVMMISNYDSRLQFRLLNAVCGEVLEHRNRKHHFSRIKGIYKQKCR